MTHNHEQDSCCSAGSDNEEITQTKKKRTDFRMMGFAVAVLACAGLITHFSDRDGTLSRKIESEMSAAKGYEVSVEAEGYNEAMNKIAPAAGDEMPVDGDVVVAEVNGKKIYRSDVMPMMEQAAQGKLSQLGVEIEQIFPMFIEQIVSGELVLQEAEKANIEQDEMYKEQLEKTKEQVKRNIFLVKMADDTVTEEAMKEMYQTEVDQLPDLPEVQASHILVKEEEEAKAIIKELNEGADFAELAKSKSTGPSGPKGGELGYFAKGDMVPEFSEVAFKLGKGEISQEPVKTQFGWHVIKVTDTRLRPKPVYEDVKDQVEEALRKKTLDEYLVKLRENADVKIYDYNGNPIEEQAPAAGVAE